MLSQTVRKCATVAAYKARPENALDRFVDCARGLSAEPVSNRLIPGKRGQLRVVWSGLEGERVAVAASQNI